jgi:hypothetical protein
MKKIIGLTIKTVILVSFLSCNNKHTDPKISEIDRFKSKLVEKAIPNTHYFISLPTDYSITENDGPGFSIYYFAPTDTLQKNKLTGGLYFGFAPNTSSMNPEGCKTEIRKGKILNVINDWKINNCKGEFSVQTIVSNSKDKEVNLKIHAFGDCFNKSDIEKLLQIYSTLKQKKG